MPMVLCVVLWQQVSCFQTRRKLMPGATRVAGTSRDAIYQSTHSGGQGTYDKTLHNESTSCMPE